MEKYPLALQFKRSLFNAEEETSKLALNSLFVEKSSRPEAI